MSRASITWPTALTWRLGQQLLDPIGTGSAVDVVRRLGAVKAEPDFGAELAIRARQRHAPTGEVARAIAEGRIIQAFAFRGAVHLMTAQDAGIYLALRAASRMWELPSWQTYYGLAPSDWPAFRAAVRDALTAGPLTRQELGAAITALPRYQGLRMAFEDKTWTLLKALFWQGDVSFGPPRGGRSTFQRLDQNPHWAGIPGLDEAGARAVEAYFRTYGPRRLHTPSTGSVRVSAPARSGSRPGSRASETALPRSMSAGRPPGSCATTLTDCWQPVPAKPCGSSPATTSGSSVRVPRMSVSCHPPGERW